MNGETTPVSYRRCTPAPRTQQARRTPLAGFARPELIATPEWLAENVGRADLRVVDVRWRPDGSALTLFGTGHIPGAVHLDWRTTVVEAAETGDALLLSAPDHLAAVMSRVGVGDGTSVVLYDDTLSYFAARVWWSLRAYGHESARILEAGYPAWVEAGNAVVNGTRHVPGDDVHAAGPGAQRLTTADVRGLIGAPDVQLVDARGPAEYHGYEGNVRRLGHIPGAVNLPVAAMHQPGTQRLRDAWSWDAAAQVEHHARPPAGLLRRLGGRGGEAAYVLTLLGHEDVAVYDGGWAEWGDPSTCQWTASGRTAGTRRSRRHPTGRRDRRRSSRICRYRRPTGRSPCTGRGLGAAMVHRDHRRLLAGLVEGVRPVRRVRHREEAAGQVAEGLAQALRRHQVDLADDLERRDRDAGLGGCSPSAASAWSAVVVATANRTASRFTWAYSSASWSPGCQLVHRESSRTRNASSARSGRRSRDAVPSGSLRVTSASV